MSDPPFRPARYRVSPRPSAESRPEFRDAVDRQLRSDFYSREIRGFDARRTDRMKYERSGTTMGSGRNNATSFPKIRTDYDALREEYRFAQSAKDDDRPANSVAREYESKLFREYALVILSRWKEGKIGMRWRVKEEVLKGIGERTCGNTACGATSGLHTFEVPFSYVEGAVKHETLVKVRLCSDCEAKMSGRLSKSHETSSTASTSDRRSPSLSSSTESNCVSISPVRHRAVSESPLLRLRDRTSAREKRRHEPLEPRDSRIPDIDLFLKEVLEGVDDSSAHQRKRQKHKQ